MFSTSRSATRRVVSLALAAPLALALAACGGAADDAGGFEGDPIAAIPAPEGTSWTETVTVTEQDGYLLGNPDAPLKLVEYASHTCGACANFSSTAKQDLKEQYIASGVVSFEQRNLVRDPVDLAIATLVRCGADENMQALSDQAWGSFNEIMNNAQTAGQQIQESGSLPIEQRFVRIAQVSGLLDFFASRGISTDQAEACLSDAATVEGIANASAAQADELGIQSTPTFILNGQVLEARQWPELEPVLQRACAR
ncbi:MAG: thioredoxin domain-containing protein [Pseudomonadota bacterium]